MSHTGDARGKPSRERCHRFGDSAPHCEHLSQVISTTPGKRGLEMKGERDLLLDTELLLRPSLSHELGQLGPDAKFGEQIPERRNGTHC